MDYGQHIKICELVKKVSNSNTHLIHGIPLTSPTTMSTIATQKSALSAIAPPDQTGKEHTPYPAIRRLVTGHTDAGHSTFASVDEVKPHFFQGGDAMITGLFWGDKNRPDLSGPFEDDIKKHPDELCGKEGFTMKVVDTPPWGKSVSFSASSDSQQGWTHNV